MQNPRHEEIARHVAEVVRLIGPDVLEVSEAPTFATYLTHLRPYLRLALGSGVSDPRAIEFEVSASFWDVSEGLDRADEVAEAEAETVRGVENGLLRIAEWVEELHSGVPDEDVSAQSLLARKPTVRSMLTRNQGETVFRQKYVAGGRDYLITARFKSQKG